MMQKITVQSGATYATVAKAEGVTAPIEGVAEDKIVTTNTATMEKFAGGLGIEASPYLIENSTQFKNIVNGASTSKKCYYKLISDIQFTDDQIEKGATNTSISVYYPQTLKDVVIDGQGFKLIAGNDKARFFDLVRYSTFKNIDVYENNGFIMDAIQLNFYEVDTYGSIEVSGNSSAYVTYARMSFVFDNCTNYASIIGKGGESDYNAIFVGYPYSSNQTLTFRNCVNMGSISCGKASMFVGNASCSYLTLKVDKCENKGVINATYIDNSYNMNYYISVKNKIKRLTLKANDNTTQYTIDGELSTLPKAYDGSDTLIINNGTVVNGPANTGMALTKNEDGTFNLVGATNNTVNGKSIAKYEIGLGLYVGVENGSNRFYATETIAATSSNTYTSSIKDLKFVDSAFVGSASVTADAFGNRTCVIDGTTYYVVDDNENTNGQAKAAIIYYASAYDADGNLLGSVSLTK